jgi:protease IV
MIWFIKPKKRKKIARIAVQGAIAQGTRKRLLEAFKQIEERQFPALLLRIDSPGGTVADSHEIYCALKQLQQKMQIVASFGNISASGGVYISMGAHKIVTNPGTITGSIGVILRGNNLEKLLDRVGVSFKVIKSGPYKDILSFDRELSPEEQVILQDLIDSTYNQFTGIIAENRNLPIAQVRSFADGRIFSGEQALALGTVDRLGTEEDARRWVAELAGLDPDKAKVENFEEPKALLNRVTGSQLRGGDRGFITDLLSNPGLARGLTQLEFEFETQGLPLWLYRP